MKKNLFIVVLCLLMAFVTVSCEKEPVHEHTYTAEWKSDATNHWKECSCGEKTEVAEHTFGENTVKDGKVVQICSVCNYKKEITEAVLVSTAEELKTALNGEATTIYLGNDIKVEEMLKINGGKTLTLDLNGKTITNSKVWDGASSSANPYLIHVSGADTKLTVKGNGKVFADSSSLDSTKYTGNTIEDARLFAMEVLEGATVTIENGEFIGSGDCIYCHTGKVYIKDGKFSLQYDWLTTNYTGKFLLNCNNTNFKASPRTADIVVTGGTFVGFNPATGNGGAGAETTFVADGYESVKTKESTGTTPAEWTVQKK